MAELTIANLPDALLEKLKLRAERQQRSVEEEAAHILEQAVGREEKTHSLLELEGLGKELWQGIDVEAYIDEERRSWD